MDPKSCRLVADGGTLRITFLWVVLLLMTGGPAVAEIPPVQWVAVTADPTPGFQVLVGGAAELADGRIALACTRSEQHPGDLSSTELKLRMFSATGTALSTTDIDLNQTSSHAYAHELLALSNGELAFHYQVLTSHWSDGDGYSSYLVGLTQAGVETWRTTLFGSFWYEATAETILRGDYYPNAGLHVMTGYYDWDYYRDGPPRLLHYAEDGTWLGETSLREEGMAMAKVPEGFLYGEHTNGFTLSRIRQRDGSAVWDTTYADREDDYLSIETLTILNNGHIMLGGQRMVNDEAIVICCDETGSELWRHTYPAFYDVIDMLEIHEGHVLLALKDEDTYNDGYLEIDAATGAALDLRVPPWTKYRHNDMQLAGNGDVLITADMNPNGANYNNQAVLARLGDGPRDAGRER